ncbi:unnamed protein product [Diamesa tonsa]
MELFAGKCELKSNETLGRFLVAGRDLKAGELILCESPAIISIGWNSEICCLNCYKKPFKICKNCIVAPLCSKCVTHNELECEFYKKHKIDMNFIISNFNVVSPIRFIAILLNNTIDNDNDDFKVNDLLMLESHVTERRDSPIWKFIQHSVVEPIINNFKDCRIDAELVQQVCGILDVNTFELRNFDVSSTSSSDNFLRGLFSSAALMNHECSANTLITLDGGNNLRIYANRLIKKDEVITHNYTNVLNGTIERQKYLREGKYFTCQCKRCEDPTEHGTNMSSIACNNCNEFKLFNPKHWIVIDAKQRYVSLLRERGNLKLKTLLKKQSYINDVIEIVKIVEPNLSRIYGITMYEKYRTLYELAQLEYETEIIKETDFNEKLSQCEAILKEAIGNLLYEPPGSPESKLMRFAMQELKWLRISFSN